MDFFHNFTDEQLHLWYVLLILLQKSLQVIYFIGMCEAKFS